MSDLSEEDKAWLTVYALLKADGKVTLDEDNHFAIDAMRPKEIAEKWFNHPSRNKNVHFRDDTAKRERYVTAGRIFFAKTYYEMQDDDR